MNTKVETINNPKTTESLKHLEEMFNNAKIALVEGKAIILVQTIGLGEQHYNQSLFSEVANDTILAYNTYSNTMTLKSFRF